VFVFTWVYVGLFQGRAGCGAFTPWQGKHENFDSPPEKYLPWQIWQETKPELPGACFAETPWF
jgi:hypothetical protein